MQLHGNLGRYGFAKPVYALNPRRDEIWGGPCYRDFASLPEPPDHIAVLVPAAGVPELLRQGAAAGARSATVFTSGFEEGKDPVARSLAAELADVIRETGMAVSGPNCFGNLAVPARLVTLMEPRKLPARARAVGARGAERRGDDVHQPHAGGARALRPLHRDKRQRDRADRLRLHRFHGGGPGGEGRDLLHGGHPRPREVLSRACRRASDTGTFVVMLKLGSSAEGKAAAMAHTGALAGSAEVFDAVAGAVGVIRADSLDEAVETAELLTHVAVPKGRRLGAVTLSGAYRGMLLDAASRAGLEFPPLRLETTAWLDELLGAGSIVGNPLDGGFAAVSSEETYRACLNAIDADPGVDILLIQEELPRQPGMARQEKYIAVAENFARTQATKPVVMVAMLTHSHTDHSRGIRGPDAAPRLPAGSEQGVDRDRQGRPRGRASEFGACRSRAGPDGRDARRDG